MYFIILYIELPMLVGNYMFLNENVFIRPCFVWGIAQIKTQNIEKITRQRE